MYGVVVTVNVSVTSFFAQSRRGSFASDSSTFASGCGVSGVTVFLSTMVMTGTRSCGISFELMNRW